MSKLPTTQFKDVVWKPTFITKIHDNPPYESQWLFKIILPDWLAVWDVFADWERQHLLSMKKHLKRGDVLFDIGAEVGWQSVIFANFVGAENMVLIEPSDEFWGNIKAIWRKNLSRLPLACYQGLFSNMTTSKKVLPLRKFPRSKTELVRGLSYRYIHEHKKVPQITLDDFVKLTGVIPNALTIDVEGAELLVLKGAERTLKEHDIQIWVSIHDELSLLNYNHTPEDVHDYLQKLGYIGEFLDKPNEEHWYYRRENNVG